ncbi:MAG: hypothetical protein ACOCQA_01650 [bacterium]
MLKELMSEVYGEEMILEKIYFPVYGVIYDKLEKNKSSKYKSVEFKENYPTKEVSFQIVTRELYSYLFGEMNVMRVVNVERY